MPPIRNATAPKPMKTERTHEENQERAYVAASRRSDRSLEARVESARRASEIHKRRTGRSLKVDEQSVLNEDMYEEEDDDLPAQMRRLTAHLSMTGAGDFHRRFQAYMAQHVAMRQHLGGAAGDWQQNNQYNNYNGQYMNPGMMQMPPQGYQQQMYQPQMAQRSPVNYRPAPYPMHSNMMQHTMRPNTHSRSMSIAMPQEMANYQQAQLQQSQSAQVSPVEVKHMDDRRMSLPAHAAMPPTPQSHRGSHDSPSLSRTGSSTNLATPHAFFKPTSQSPPQMAAVPQQQQQPFQQTWSSNTSPLSMTLPPNMEQVLADNPAFMNDPTMSAMMPPQSGITPRPGYSYNPNGKPRDKSSGSSPSQKAFEGLSQTLMPSSLDTGNLTMFDNSAFTTSPQSANNEQFFSPQTPHAFAMGFDSAATGFDMFSGTGMSSQSQSGHVTPQEVENWNSFLNFADDPVLGYDSAAVV
ncbi:hypothetical protein BAUCODRAFT_357991 [Baudoinia panamericana UAMH 10762]|uniref:Uncharacterized protein n=1 Tax=Baudoinia panamericana (strain UAMH 10762) TaxID=717646 RepID=M2N7A1_BAUPA|nr:uncharacterized protein BAUCODRAFT_357991 [Baudoinia panamericana UAMH 10762]EMC99968.1 hypothetical protein BAUCODRAFT_357991 [Baudoinia panamericana UAMH 10762]